MTEVIDINARKSRLLKISLLMYALLILVLGWTFAIRQIRMDRMLTLETSNNQLTMTATTLAKHVEAMIFDGVGAATAGASEVQALDSKHKLTAAEMSTILSRMLTGGDYVHSLFIITPSVFVTAQHDQSEVAAERPAWSRDLLRTTSDTWVGKPLNLDQGDIHVLIPIARRVLSVRGETTWAGALFSVSSLDAMYRSLPVENSGVSLISEDARLLIRMPIVPGKNFAGADISNMEAYKRYKASPRQLLTTLQSLDVLTGKPRQFAARRVESYPIEAVAGRNVEDSLLAWRERTRASLWMFAIASIALMVLTIALYVVLQRRFQAIARSEQRFQLAVKGTNDGIWEWEIAADRVYYSLRFRQLLGYAETDEFPPVTATFWQLVHPDDLRVAELALQRHLLHHDLYDVELRIRVVSGEYKWFRTRGQALWNERGDAFRMAGSISDINDRKLAEQELRIARDAELHAEREFAQQLLLAQERERQRLANELHDSVGQNLSLIKNRASLMLQLPDLPPVIARHATSMEQLTAEVISEVRAVAQNLRPLHIEELGLTSALDSLLCKVSESGKLKIVKRLENVDDVLVDAAATHVFRIVQEAMNNIIKHSRAESCRVILQRDIHFARLIIADDGAGFDVAVSHGHGLGLASMAERCQMMMASLQLSSLMGSGTTIQIEFPIAEAVMRESTAPE